jgi:hypothetical protein
LPNISTLRRLFAALAAATAFAAAYAFSSGSPTAVAAPLWNGRVVVHAMEYPWSAVGRLNAGGRNYCTGVLVSERHVLTEARCLYNGTEGRWFSPTDLHFIAGYQRDSYRIHSGVSRYLVPPRYSARNELTLANIANNWTILTLERPLGRQAGWIGIQWLDRDALNQLERGKAYLLEAGYRAGQSHVITITPGCGIESLLRRGLLAQGLCKTYAYEAGLAKLLFIDGEFRVVAPRAARAPDIRRILGTDSFRSSHAPAPGSLASRQPSETVRQLLRRLGYLDIDNAHSNGVETRAAIMEFENEQGLPETGQPSVYLLGRLIPAAN